MENVELLGLRTQTYDEAADEGLDRKRRARRYLVGAAAGVVGVVWMGVCDDFPFFLSFWHDRVWHGDSAGVMFIIVAAVVGCNWWKRECCAQPTGVIDGFLAVCVSVGLYLAPYLMLHQALLCLAIIAWVSFVFHAVRVREAAVEDVIASAVGLVAAFSLALVVANSFGIAPIAGARVESAAGAGDAEGSLSDLMRDLTEGKSLCVREDQEVVDTLQQFVHVECARLGLAGHEPQVVLGLLGSSSSRYCPQPNRICINPIVLHDPARGLSLGDLIDACAYECAHAFEWAMVEGLIPASPDGPLGPVTPDDTLAWKRELSRPILDEGQTELYLMGDGEIRAMVYAYRAAERYRDAAGLGVVVGDFSVPCEIRGLVK